MVTIRVDDASYPAKAGENLLKTLLSLGLDLPYFCWHPALGAVGACRQCAVVQYKDEQDSAGRLVMACMTPVADKLRIGLQAPAAREFRASVIEFLMTNHPHDCPVCEEGGECHLQDMTVMTGHTYRRYRGQKRTHRNQYLGPFVNHEMNRCIACYRCVRFYDDYAGGSDLQVFASRNNVYFGRQEDGVLESEFSGNLVEICPTGVFTDRPFSAHYTRKWDLQAAPSICVHCGLGCNTSPGERYGTLRRVVNRYHGEVNGYFLCDRGRFGYGFVNGPDRIRQPSLDGRTIPAVDAEELLREILDDTCIGIGSPQASLEANFALREAVGAENFYAGIEAAEHGILAAMVEILRDWPVHSPSIRETESADAILVLAEDLPNTAPRLALAIRQAVRNRAVEAAGPLKIAPWQDAAVREIALHAGRSPLFLATPAATRLDDVAALTFRNTPEAIARLGFSVAHALLEEAPPPEALPAEDRDTALAIAEALKTARRPLIVTGTGCRSLGLIEAAANIALALARIRNTATDLAFTAPECNSLGLAMMDPLPLSEAFARTETRESPNVVILENDLYRRAPAALADRFLARAEYLAAIDHTRRATGHRADLLLPCAAFAETEGTLINSEGRAQRFFSVMPPKDGARDSWRWLTAPGKRAIWSNLDSLTRACAQAIPALAGIIDAAPGAGFRVKGQPVAREPHRYSGRTAMIANLEMHEPKPMADGDSALVYSMEGDNFDAPPALRAFSWAPGWSSNQQSIGKFQDEIGGHLRGGDPGVRLLADGAAAGRWFLPLPPEKSAADGAFGTVPLHHVFGSEELSNRSAPIAERIPAPYAALNPVDVARLGAKEFIEVDWEGATVQLPIRRDPDMREGHMGVPMGLPGLPLGPVPAAVRILRVNGGGG